MNVLEINVLVLAYLGDAIYENYVREYLIKSGIAKVLELQKESVKYVSAKSQCKILSYLIENNLLTEIELDVVKRRYAYENSWICPSRIERRTNADL